MPERTRSLSLPYLKTLMPAPSLVRFLEQYGGTKIYVPKTLGLAANRIRSCPLEGVIAWSHMKELRERFGGLDVSIPMGKQFLATQYKNAGLGNKVIASKLRVSLRQAHNLTKYDGIAAVSIAR